MFSFQKCLYFCAFIITICPRRSHIGARTINNDRNTKQKTVIPIGRSDSSAVNDTARLKRLSIQGDTMINYGNLEVSEPGFDFTDEEMQKLKIWPGGTIPYFIDDYSFDKVLRDRLRAFLEHANTVTGVHFYEMAAPPSDDDSRWVFFINRRGVLPCDDLDFRQFTSTGVQKVVIGYDCMEPGNLAEIVLAVAGVPPQHNSPDRDRNVLIKTFNILPGKEHLFKIFSASEWLFHELEYDFTSAGHYGYHKYTKNGQSTIEPHTEIDVRAGQVNSFSFTDIWKMRMLYNYISKKGRNSEHHKGTCSKLFKPGAKFVDFIPDDHEDDMGPRPKPSLYTGIREEPLPRPHEDEDDDDDRNERNAYKGGEEKTKSDDASEDNNEVEENTNKAETRAKLKGSQKGVKKIDKTALLGSDVQTDE